ncbi:hypothetical protein D0Z08_21330 [Nocardioides immobilis]|uniref:Uncharacterized protein n=1 Tax=Nocardioides immobilis TaxID=2049295 RepID=A0A417XXK1_9ACTN|nr:hypothetical protein [Nocardioides immobilis]RHW24991.1 hypothetical protein D0Z08_21330 [Nocardioides immobilis]
MALRLTGVTPSPLLNQPAFAADGSEARLRTYSGDITIAQDSGVIMYRAGQVDAMPMSFVPPDAEPLKAGVEPALAAEVTIAQILTTGSVEHFSGAGAAGVSVALQPDQNDAAWCWPHLSFQALGTRPMVLRYRLTVLTSLSRAAGDVP